MAAPRQGMLQARGRALSRKQLAKIERLLREGRSVERIAKEFHLGKERVALLRDDWGIPAARGGPKPSPILEQAAREYAAGVATSAALATKYGLWSQSIRHKAHSLGLLDEDDPRFRKRLKRGRPPKQELPAEVDDLAAVAHFREQAKQYEARERHRLRTDPYAIAAGLAP